MDLDDVGLTIRRCFYITLLRVQIIADLLDLSFSHISRELPYNTPFIAELKLITASFESWSQIARQCVDKVVTVWQGQIMKLARNHWSSEYPDRTCVISLLNYCCLKPLHAKSNI